MSAQINAFAIIASGPSHKHPNGEPEIIGVEFDHKAAVDVARAFNDCAPSKVPCKAYIASFAVASFALESDLRSVGRAPARRARRAS